MGTTSTEKPADTQRTFLSILENGFESVLWASRFAVVIAVVASLAIAAAMFYVATVDTVLHLSTINQYASASLTSAQHEELRTQTIANVVEAIDGYLLATVMLIFGFGLYELFISQIDTAGKKIRSRVLTIHSLDDLKHRLGQVVLLILVVKFFEGALAINIKTLSDLLLLSIGILLIAVALYLTHKHANGESEPSDNTPKT
jgi:uncharacterized membrane protein YqhA